MANRRVGNALIIDTVGKISLQPGDTKPTGKLVYKVGAVGFLSLDTTARVQIAQAANTANLYFDFTTILPTSHIPCFQVYNTGDIWLDQLQVITVTQGTAWLYLR